jgi:hypothetical protein
MKQMGTINKSAMEFSRSATVFMQKISNHLQGFNISGLSYVKTFRDGKRLYISSLQNWSEFYIEKNLQDNLNSMEMYLPPTYVQQFSWEGLKNNKVMDSFREFGVRNALVLLEHSKEYVELFSFVTNFNKPQIDLLNKLPFLREFIKNFKLKAADLIDTTDKRKLISPTSGISFDVIQHPSYVQQEKICDFLNYLEQAEFPRKAKVYYN